MPNQRACLPCKYPDADDYVRRRQGEGANLQTIRSELNTPFRKKMYGYEKGPTLMMLQQHNSQHRKALPVSTTNSPSFRGSTPSSSLTVPGDVATAIQAEALAALERGEMRVTASNALKAQEILDRRAEKAADRELTLVLARLATMSQAPITIIEGEVTDLGTADD
jgi:hypothetical protein